VTLVCYLQTVVSKCLVEKELELNFYAFLYYTVYTNYMYYLIIRIIVHFDLYNCLVLVHTKKMVSNGFTATHSQPNPFTAVIAWTWS
jgi:hypothetical protein